MYNFKLTEEISRWAFEVICMKSPDWYIAFTNPTAGPWKTIKGLNEQGIEGEVFRFELEDTRPDIILVNDKMKLVIIIEAKDSLTKLISNNQAEKSIEVVNKLSSILNNKATTPYWGVRSDYAVLTGLLWGAETASNNAEREIVFDAYYSEIKKHNKLDSRLIIGIETCRVDNGLFCSITGKFYEDSHNKIELKQIADSFNLSIIQ